MNKREVQTKEQKKPKEINDHLTLERYHKPNLCVKKKKEGENSSYNKPVYSVHIV